MSNINFDNPFLLLIGIPLLLIVVIPFIISVKKENVNKHNVISFIIHTIICILVTLVFAKTTYELVITETNIYVVADVSYSSNHNLELVDEYIENIEEDMPKNSKLGIICFGKDQELLTSLGGKIKSVKDSKVDNSTTNITEALEYAGSLFSSDVIKRIVLITDGKETNESNLVSVIDALSNDNVYVDAIYLDNNIREDVNEIQINSIEYVDNTYLNNSEKLQILIQSNNIEDTLGKVMLYQNDQFIDSSSEKFVKGFNVVTFNLPTNKVGQFNYKIEVQCENKDTSYFNNVMYFDQKVNEKLNMLMITSKNSDVIKANELYSSKLNLETILVSDTNKDVPFTIEALCKYDIFALSNINIAEDIENPSLFLSSINALVDDYGKSLITIGNTYIQSNIGIKNEHLTSLSNILPINYGNDNAGKKALVIVMDMSRSMQSLSKFKMAQAAAIKLIDYLKIGDRIAVVGYAGDTKPIYENGVLDSEEERQLIKDAILAIEPINGTYLTNALNLAYRYLLPYPDFQREVMVIGDFLLYQNTTDERDAARELASQRIAISSLNCGSSTSSAVKLAEDIATIGNGYYYFAEDEEEIDTIIKEDIADDFTDTVVERGEYVVEIEEADDKVLSEIYKLPNLNGYYFSSLKSSATTVLTSKFQNNKGETIQVPIYSYWNYGKGKVASFASEFSGDWVSKWQSDTTGEDFFLNMIFTNTPKRRVDAPFILELNKNGSKLDIIVSLPNINLNSSFDLDVTYPNGEAESLKLAFNSKQYATTIDIEDVGSYKLDLKYNYGSVYESSYTYTQSYLAEYNSFEKYQISDLYHMISDNGEISNDGHLKLENDNSYVETYIYDFTNVFMAICVCLFVVDIIIRKLKWNDIKTLFNIKRKVK